jgi:hypothetical protein
MAVQLEHTTILRAGITASRYNHESANCRLSVNDSLQTLEFGFCPASKGGGTTDVLLRIGEGDLPAILEAIAEVLKLKGLAAVDE